MPKQRKIGGNITESQVTHILDDEQRNTRNRERYVDDLMKRPLGSQEKIESALFFMPELKKVLNHIDKPGCTHLKDTSEHRLYTDLMKSYDIKAIQKLGVEDDVLPILLRMIADARNKLNQCCPQCAKSGGRRTRKRTRTSRPKKKTQKRTRKRRSKRNNRRTKR